jgi:hypothetical protein
MSTTYWKATKTLSATINKIYEDHRDWMAKYHNLARRLGFSEHLAIGMTMFGDQFIVGFYTKRDAADPDKKLYKRSKSVDERGKYCWIPKIIKANEKINALIGHGNSFERVGLLTAALGIKQTVDITMYRPGIYFRESIVYVQLHESQGTPKGCRQITDMKFRQITGK